MTNKVWFVKLNNDCLYKTLPYGVFLGGFRDSSHYNKWEAQQRADYLNSEERSDGS